MEDPHQRSGAGPSCSHSHAPTDWVWPRPFRSARSWTCGVALLLVLTTASGMGAADFPAPRSWAGQQAGSLTGNPAVVDGDPTWLASQVWPAVLENGQDYQTMPWNGTDAWAATANTDRGAPALTLDQNGSIVLKACGPWGRTMPGEKTPALTFIAPAPGMYILTGTAIADIWAGKQVKLWILVRSGSTLVRLTGFKLQSHKPMDIFNVSASLKTHEGLVLAPRFDEPYVGANITLKNLTIHLRR